MNPGDNRRDFFVVPLPSFPIPFPCNHNLTKNYALEALSL